MIKERAVMGKYDLRAPQLQEIRIVPPCIGREVDAQGNLWPVDDMEGPTPRPTAQVTPAQVRRAQAEAQRLERQLQQQQAAQLPGVVSPGSVPPPEAAVGPGWVTLTTHQQRAQGQNTPF